MSEVAHHKTLPLGHKLLWYKIEGILGQGGFGITYLARDTNLDRLVAVKEYLPGMFAQRGQDFTVAPLSQDQGENFKWGLSRFLTEAQTLARFKHKNIVQVQTVFEQYGTAYMVMEYEQGQSLANLIHYSPASFGQPFLENILFPVMDGLQLIHNAGFIHRDIKPANIYLREDHSPVLIDFGSARQTSIQNTGEMTALVSQGYTPLEQYSTSFGEQGPWTDIYAFAASVYHGITGKMAEDSLSRSAAVQFGKPDPLKPLRELVGKDFSDRFVSAVDQALLLDPRERPQSLREWRAIFLDDDDKTVFAPLLATKKRNSTVSVVTDADDDSTMVMPLTGNAPAGLASQRKAATVPGVAASAQSTPPAGDNTAYRPLPDRKRKTPEVARAVRTPTARAAADTASQEKAQVTPTLSLTRLKRLKHGNYLFAGLAAALIVVFVGGGAWLFFAQGDSTGPATTTAFSVEAALQDLPKPGQSVALRSPVERIRTELAELTQVGNAYIKSLAADAQSQPALLGLRFVADRLQQLGQLSLVQVHPELRPALSEALGKIAQSDPQLASVKAGFDSAPDMPAVAELEQLLEKTTLSPTDLLPRERQRLVFGLAFLSPGERQQINTDDRVSALLKRFKQAIVKELENGRFAQAAQMLELAMLVQPQDTDLSRLSAHLLQ